MPKSAVKIHDQARGRRAKLGDLLKHRLHIPQIIDCVRQDDHVKMLTVQRERVCIGLDEFHLRVLSTGAADHLPRNIDPQGAARSDSCKEIAFSAADLQHAEPRGDQELIDFRQPGVVARTPTLPGVASGGDAIPVGAACAPVSGLDHVWSGRGCHRLLLYAGERALQRSML